jgi:hypothetical protein
MPLPPVWWLDDSNAPTNSPKFDTKKLKMVIDLVGDYTIKDLEEMAKLREKIMKIEGIPPQP